ncbi:MAG: ketopantoate reductase family protein [Deltaproteobacteria bacterium]|nr:ketopantoate reductase family protein [Deltaproteobacteria bacterium]
MSSSARVSVIGAGAMGSFYASKFYDMDRECVSLVAGGERCESLRQKGLTVNDKHYPLHVISTEENVPPADLLIVAVKHHHLEQTIKDMGCVIGKDTAIISVMNGIESEDRIGAVYGMEKMLYAVAVGIDALRQEERVVYTKQGKLFFGEACNHSTSERVRKVQALFDRAGIEYEIPEDMIRNLWWKFMINVGINQVSAVLRAPFSVFQKSDHARQLMELTMREVMDIGRVKGVNLHEEDIKNWYSFMSQLSPKGKTSMLQDIDARRKTEVEMFAGKIIELGEKHAVPTPVNNVLFKAIKAIEEYID